MRRVADYVGTDTKSFAGDIRYIVEYEVDPPIPMPTDQKKRRKRHGNKDLGKIN